MPARRKSSKSTPPRKSHVTDAQILARWERGQTSSEIARAVGLSRERIRQRLARHGLGGRNKLGLPKPDDILAAARKSNSMQSLATALGIPLTRLESCFRDYNIRDKVLAIHSKNRETEYEKTRQATKKLYVQRLREVAVQVGRTPTQADLEEHNIYHVLLIRHFGSAAAALKAAGLVPNKPGMPPKALTPKFLASAKKSKGGKKGRKR